MSDPLVSVVIPVYKVEQYLERCLDSVTAQDYRSMEVILVNDGSPDGCGEIIQRYEARWPFIRSIWQENQGVSAARNVGIASATGKYVALIDSDDYVEADFLSSLVDIAEQKDAEVAICNFFFDFPNGIKVPFPFLSLHKDLSGETAAQMSLNLLNIPAFSWNKLYRRDLFTEHNISYPPIYYEDIATTSRVLLQARHVAITHKSYYHYCLRRSGITGNFGIRNIVDYLKAVDIIRYFIWNKKLWTAWGKPYRKFLRTVEAQLLFEITVKKNVIPLKRRNRLIRQVHRQIRELSKAPETDPSDLTAGPHDLKETI